MPNKSALRVVGILFCSSGLVALAAPMMVSIAIELIAGWLFIFIGTIQIIAAAQSIRQPVVRGTLGLGVVSLLLGVVLIAAPAAGLQTLTLLVALIFMLSGALKLALGRYLSGPPVSHVLFLSGLASTSLGALIALTMPQSATITLGLLLGAEMLSHGVAALVIASTPPD